MKRKPKKIPKRRCLVTAELFKGGIFRPKVIDSKKKYRREKIKNVQKDTCL